MTNESALIYFYEKTTVTNGTNQPTTFLGFYCFKKKKKILTIIRYTIILCNN